MDRGDKVLHLLQFKRTRQESRVLRTHNFSRLLQTRIPEQQNTTFHVDSDDPLQDDAKFHIDSGTHSGLAEHNDTAPCVDPDPVTDTNKEN